MHCFSFHLGRRQVGLGQQLGVAGLGEGGEVFALDMGEPVKIAYLAEQMIRLAGRQPGRDVAIAYTGLRPGEKLFEELFHPQEAYGSTAHPKIMLARARSVVGESLDGVLNQAQQAVAAYDETALEQCLRTLVPEFDREPVTVPLLGARGGDAA